MKTLINQLNNISCGSISEYRWFVIDPVANKVFGPKISYKEICLLAEAIDNRYGCCISRIEKAKSMNHCLNTYEIYC